MTQKKNLVNVHIRITPADKKKARDLEINISQIARHAIKARIKYLTMKAKREAQEQIPRVITPDQVTLTGSPAQLMPQCTGITIPAEVILDKAIAELEKGKAEDPEGSSRGEVTSYGCSSGIVQSTDRSVTPGMAEIPDREVTTQ